MISARQDIIRTELEAGTGAEIGMSIDQSGTRTALRIWFSDLDVRHGPVAELRPHGLRGYRVVLGFGKFAGEVVRQIQAASAEDVGLARALVASIGPAVEVDIPGQGSDDWRVASGAFTITATARSLPDNPDEAVTVVCREVIVPLMAAMTDPVILKRRVRDVAADLPDRIDIDLPLELDERLARHYVDVREATLEKYPVAGALVATLQLQLVCAHPWLRVPDATVADWDDANIVVHDEMPLITPKLERVTELLSVLDVISPKALDEFSPV